MATDIYISWEDTVQIPLGPVTGSTMLQIFLSRVYNPNYIYSIIQLACPKIISLVLPFIMMSSLFIAHMEVIFPFSQSPILFVLLLGHLSLSCGMVLFMHLSHLSSH